MDIYHYRRGLAHTLAAVRRGSITLGFIGGSITDGQVDHNWPDPVIAWFCRQFPHLRITVENAALGATGSELGVFRAQRDLIDRGCDLVFVEYAVNDGGEPPEARRRTQEGLVRKLLAGEGRDIILVYTFGQSMYALMMGGETPPSIRELDEVGAHYGVGSVWAGLHALEEVKAGQMRWEQWLPDGLHPQGMGSLSYARSVIQFLQNELLDSPSPGQVCVGAQRPAPLNPLNWESARVLAFSQVKLSGPWVIRRWPYMPWADQVLDTAAVGARLQFQFRGRALSLGFDFGKRSSEFRYRLDGGDWVAVTRERPAWAGDRGWFRMSRIGDDLARVMHDFELEVTHGDRTECTGTNFRLALIGVVE